MLPIPRWTSQQIVNFRPRVDRPNAGLQALNVLREIEAADPQGSPVHVLTLFLRGSECRFRCLMCDLWQHTYDGVTPAGSLATQVNDAVLGIEDQQHGMATWIKLYNASNFFSPVNVPVADFAPIASSLQSFERVVVENHPKLLGDNVELFRSLLSGRLEVAMGLETVHFETLQRLNKQMTATDFRLACQWLLDRDIDIRTFVLLRPPGMSRAEGIEWCVRSAQYARECGARHISLIPLRSGNGAIERLAELNLFAPPDAQDLAVVLEEVLQWGDVVVTADLWDWERLPFEGVGNNDPRRQMLKEKIEKANLLQKWS